MWSDGEAVSTPSSASMAALPFADQPRNAENPAFGQRHGAFGRRQVWIEEGGEAAVPVGAGEPSGDGIGVVLIRGAPLAGEAAAPQRRIDLGEMMNEAGGKTSR